jgi:FkbM family methyltransferase
MKYKPPGAVRRPLGIVISLIRRLNTWGKVARSISGVSTKDKRILRHAVLRAPVTVFRNLGQWQFPIVEKDCSVISRGTGTFHVRAQTDDLFHVLPMQEPSVETSIRSILRPGDTFIDAGANIGFYTVLASRLVGEKGQVFSFEMVPITADILRLHVQKNDLNNVKVIEGALAETADLTVQASLVEGKSGQSSISIDRGTIKIEVSTITLANTLKDMPSIHLIKMDLEGAELGALKGMGSDLEKVHAIIFENRGAKDVVEYLQAHCFNITRLDGNNALALKAT